MNSGTGGITGLKGGISTGGVSLGASLALGKAAQDRKKLIVTRLEQIWG